jgi:hypothetical protein
MKLMSVSYAGCTFVAWGMEAFHQGQDTTWDNEQAEGLTPPPKNPKNQTWANEAWRVIVCKQANGCECWHMPIQFTTLLIT